MSAQRFEARSFVLEGVSSTHRFYFFNECTLEEKMYVVLYCVMDLSWWPLRYVGCRLGGELGVDQTPTVSGDGFSLALKARFSILWHF